MLASNKPQSNRKVEARSTKSTRQSNKAAILKSPAVPAVVDNPVPLNLTGTGNTLAQLPSTSNIPALVFTPTTYSSLEQTLLELTPQLVPASNTSTALKSMAIKRDHDNNNDSDIDDDDDDTFTGDDSVSGDDWGSGRGAGGGKSARFDVAVDYSLSSSNHSSSAETSGPTANTAGRTGPRRHTGPRKPRTHEKLSAAEEERRRTRRERNKHAAAKCRQKRVDLTNQLLAETEQLESEQAKLQNEIKTFQREKDELEFILEAHRLHCGTNKIAASAVKQEPVHAGGGNILLVVGPAPQPVATETVVTTTAPVLTVPVTAVAEKPIVTIRRPTSLATVRFGGTPQIAGVAITTPSAGLNVYTLGLESMIDGHTGLTPITGLPVVSFAGLSTPIISIPTSGGLSLFGEAAAALAAGIGSDTPVITTTASS